MRLVACVLALCALGVAGSSAAAPARACPRLNGSVTYLRAGHEHRLDLTSCSDRIVAPTPVASRLRSRQGKVAVVAATKTEQKILVDGRAVLRVREDHRKVPGGIPGPLGLVMWSPDGKWLFYVVDPMGSASIAADGLVLRALDVASGRSVAIATTIGLDDYVTWCGSTLVVTAGEGRLATWNKRLVAARAPTWTPHTIWAAPRLAFGSVACAPDATHLAVLAQPAQNRDWNFFATRWQLWEVSLAGRHRLVDRPPAGYADESPSWSLDGRSLAFVREKKGHGSLFVLHGGRVYGPLANLGYSLGYYGHHHWGIRWGSGS